MQNYSSVKRYESWRVQFKVNFNQFAFDSDIGNKLLCGSIAGIIGTTLIFPLGKEQQIVIQ